MSTFLFNVLTHTPPWVWVLLAALVTLGLMQTRDQIVSRARMLAQPLALGALSLWSASVAFGLHASVQAMWLLGLTLGVSASHVLGLPRRVRPLPDGRFAIGGSWTPLVLMLSIFALRYGVAASLAIAPRLVAEPAFAALASLCYGLPAGLLVARALHVRVQPGRAPLPLAA
jgi:hypothetical protein